VRALAQPALPAALALPALLAALALGGCGAAGPRTATGPRIPAALLRGARRIGRGERFHPPARGPVLGACRRRLGPRIAVHVELFAANQVVLVASGIGVRGPVSRDAGRIASARCYGALVTLDPTGVVYVRRGGHPTLAALFRSWGEPLSRTRLASFSAAAGRQVRVFVGGRPFSGPPGSVPLSPHAEIVLEVGPHVPPHASYTFPPGA
jgi:hypothetical protein